MINPLKKLWYMWHGKIPDRPSQKPMGFVARSIPDRPSQKAMGFVVRSNS